jgi:hypothetical protein
MTKTVRSLVAIVSLALMASAFGKSRPTEFVTQVLEPTGGKIPRPKDWFYAESHHGPVYDWMITREDTHGGTGPYTTGVRIQTFVGVKDGTSSPPKRKKRQK